MSNSHEYKPPEQSKVDEHHTLKKAIISAIPYVGGPGTELFNKLVASPIEKRRDEWREKVGEALLELMENRGLNFEELQSNEDFMDTVLYASLIAFRTSQSEKRKALRNAVLNAALPNPPVHSLQQMFLNFIDVFTEWHLRILKLFQAPKEWDHYNFYNLNDLKELRPGIILKKNQD